MPFSFNDNGVPVCCCNSRVLYRTLDGGACYECLRQYPLPDICRARDEWKAIKKPPGFHQTASGAPVRCSCGGS